MKLRVCMSAAVLGLSLTSAFTAQAAYPERPIRMIVGGSAGSVTDSTARLVADLMGNKLGTSIVVENKPGGNGILANDFVARAPADGYTLLFTYSAAMTVNPWMVQKLPYDPVKGFTPIGRPTQPGGNLLAVNSEFDASNFDELIKKIKSAPEPPLYCSWGVGSGGHLAMEFIIQRLDLKMQHAPYKSAAACTNDLAAGHVSIAFVDTISPLPLVQSGKIRPLAQSAPMRHMAYPDVPTLIEEGVPFELSAWLGIFGPADLPQDVTEKLNKALNEAIAEPGARTRFAEQQLRPADPNTPAELQQLVVKDMQAWGDLVTSVGIKPN